MAIRLCPVLSNVQGSYEHYLANPCPWNKTMCSYMLVDDGHELVIPPYPAAARWRF